MSAPTAASDRVLAFVCALGIATPGISSEVWVVTDHRHSVKASAGVRVIELGAPAHLHGELAMRLPADPQRAAAIVQRRLKHGGVDLHRRLATAYQGVTDAWRLGVTKIPAVIVDQRYVVYGESDVSRAVEWIEKYRRTGQ